MCYSSGTSGKLKGIKQAQVNESFSARTYGEKLLTKAVGFSERTVYLSPAPLYHTAPYIWTRSVIRNGGCVVAMEEFDAERCASLIETYQVSHASLYPLCLYAC